MSDLISELKQLRLYGMASSYAEVLQNRGSAGILEIFAKLTISH